MKYIHIVQFHLMSGGGVGSVITDLGEAMARRSSEVYVISLFRREKVDFEEEKKWAERHGIKVMLMQEDPKAGNLRVLLNLRKTLKQLTQEDDCCIYMHLKWGVLAGVLSSLGLKRLKRVEVYHSGYMKYKLQASVCKPFIHRYISVSKDAKEQLIKWFGVKAEKVDVVYNGVDLEHIREKAMKPVHKEAELSLMSVGRLSFEKGFLNPIEAYGMLKSQGGLQGTSYTMIGDGPQMEEAKGLCRGCVKFTGVIPRDEVYGNIASCDIMVLPSLWEGNSILLLEVLAIGKALAVSDIQSYREVLDFVPLKEYETCRLEPFGVVFRAEDTKSCQEAMKLIEKNQDRLKDMGEVVGRLADKFSIHHQADRYIDIANRLFAR